MPKIVIEWDRDEDRIRCQYHDLGRTEAVGLLERALQTYRQLDLLDSIVRVLTQIEKAQKEGDTIENHPGGQDV